MEALSLLSEAVETGRLKIFITSSNIIETQKIIDATARSSRVLTMNSLSHGAFLSGRDKRLYFEFVNVLSEFFGVGKPKHDYAILSTSRFWEAFSSFEQIVPRGYEAFADANPELEFHRYLCGDEDTDLTLTEALRRLDEDNCQVVREIESRRERTNSISRSAHRKLISVLLFNSSQDLLLRAIRELGIPSDSLKSAPPSFLRDIVRKSPTLHVERELTVAIERERRKSTTNDLYDMQFYTATIPYMDIVVGEKAFVSRAVQLKLQEIYPVRLLSDIDGLIDLLRGQESTCPSPPARV